jgi:hypothetical protein
VTGVHGGEKQGGSVQEALTVAVTITDRERHEKAVDIALRTKLTKVHSVHLGKLGTHKLLSIGYKYKSVPATWLWN